MGESPDALDSEDGSEALQILGSLVLLTTPLSTRALAALLDIEEDDVNHWLRNLHAVLSIPTDPQAPVRPLHKSFSDFLLGQEGTCIENFRVDAAKTHTMLASRCIQRMSHGLHGLRKDICNVREPGKLRSEIGKGIVADRILRISSTPAFTVYFTSGRVGDVSQTETRSTPSSRSTSCTGLKL